MPDSSIIDAITGTDEAPTIGQLCVARNILEHLLLVAREEYSAYERAAEQARIAGHSMSYHIAAMDGVTAVHDRIDEGISSIVLAIAAAQTNEPLEACND